MTLHPIINPHPDAPEGSVTRLPSYSQSDFPPTSAILCRNNAPLISFALALLRRDVACHIVGREIQIGLEKLIGKPWEQISMELTKLRDARKFQQAANLEDKWLALQVVAAGCFEHEAIKRKLERLFASGPGVTLSTIHKAKGFEWETVFLLDWHLCPSAYAETLAERRQERNLQYIAVTRAKLNLRFISSGRWKT